MLSSYAVGAITRAAAAAGASDRYVATRIEVDALVGPAKAGDLRSIDLLLAEVQPLVVKYCRSRIGRIERSYVTADDVAQEVCMAVLSALPTYLEQGRPFLAFVFGIASHKVADAHRAAARDQAELVAELPDWPELSDGPEQQAINGECSDRMNRLMSMLPAKQREILLLRIIGGLSAEDTADAVGSTPGAVRVDEHRGLATLRRILEAEKNLVAVGDGASEAVKASMRRTVSSTTPLQGGDAPWPDADNEESLLDVLVLRADHAVQARLRQLIDSAQALAAVRAAAFAAEQPCGEVK